MKRLVDAPSNANYMSPKIQNELLGCYATVITNKIADAVNKSGMFVVLADETSSASKEFITLAVRYVDEQYCINESFLGFENVSDTTGRHKNILIFPNFSDMY